VVPLACMPEGFHLECGRRSTNQVGEFSGEPGRDRREAVHGVAACVAVVLTQLLSHRVSQHGVTHR
jgi:hypothetical protein